MTIYPGQIGTLAATIKNNHDLENENIVKVATKENLKDESFSRAENFLRNWNNIEKLIQIYPYMNETQKHELFTMRENEDLLKSLMRKKIPAPMYCPAAIDTIRARPR